MGNTDTSSWRAKRFPQGPAEQPAGKSRSACCCVLGQGLGMGAGLAPLTLTIWSEMGLGGGAGGGLSPPEKQYQHVEDGNGRTQTGSQETEGCSKPVMRQKARHGAAPTGSFSRSSCGSLSHGQGPGEPGTGCSSFCCTCSSFFQEQPWASPKSTPPHSQPWTSNPRAGA